MHSGTRTCRNYYFPVIRIYVCDNYFLTTYQPTYQVLQYDVRRRETIWNEFESRSKWFYHLCVWKTVGFTACGSRFLFFHHERKHSVLFVYLLVLEPLQISYLVLRCCVRAGWNKKGQQHRQPFGTVHSPDAASSHYSNTSMRSNNSQQRPQSAPRGRGNGSATGVYASPGPGHYNVPSSLRIQTSHPTTSSSSSSSSLHNQFSGANPVAFGRTVNPLEVSVNGVGGSSSSMLQSYSSRPLTPVTITPLKPMPHSTLLFMNVALILFLLDL